MRLPVLAAALVALAFGSPLSAGAVAPFDVETATPLPGRWSWSATLDGSQAVFLNSGGMPQLWLHCARASRIVTIARPASAAAAFLTVWATSQSRAIPASFNPTTARSTAQISAYDPLLDALAFSRGRIAVAIGATPPVIAPAWPEIARVVEDCRS